MYVDTAVLTASKDTSSRVQILDEGELLIAGTSIADTGKYKCVRANEAGQVQGEAYLTVMGMSRHLFFLYFFKKKFFIIIIFNYC